MKREIIKTLNKKRKGFTLVELVVVIAILAVLSVGAIVGFGNVRAAADDAVARANAGVIVRSLNTYNALANNPIDTAAELAATDVDSELVLTADTGLISINLNVDATADEITAALNFVDWDSTSGRWVVGS